jgi:integrase
VAQQNLTDRKLQSLKPAASGQRYEIMDKTVAGLGIRVTDTGLRSFILKTRYPGSHHPTRRTLGEYPALSLAAARDKAAQWRVLLKQGHDPAAVEQQARAAVQAKQAHTVAAVAGDFFADKLPRERQGRHAERVMRREFLSIWGARPIIEISDLDILAVVRAKKRTAPAEARNLLGLAKRFFTWAVEQRTYGLKTSPADGLKPSKIIGDKPSGDRVLSDAELFALWRAANRTPYPVGPIYKMLIMSALRLNEVADARWSEFDLPAQSWVIPKERMKAKNPAKARAHEVPLTDNMLAVINSLPRFKGGDFLFSTSFGTKPVWIGSKIKDRIDVRMLRTLQALARRRGDDPKKVMLPAWKNHDVRRTVRSNLSRLKIPEEAREALLAHARPGIKGVYDLHDYSDQKREALEAWAARLRSIVEPPSEGIVVPLRRGA